MILFKGKPKGIIHTRDIILDYDPNFEFKEKYSIYQLQEELKKLEGDDN